MTGMFAGSSGCSVSTAEVADAVNWWVEQVDGDRDDNEAVVLHKTGKLNAIDFIKHIPQVG